MMVIDNKYNIGDTCYLKTDSLQDERLITGICIRENSSIQYYLVCGSLDSWHYEFEITKEKDVVKATN